jgi:tetratricopeptide (TPR) repeat protein
MSQDMGANQVCARCGRAVLTVKGLEETAKAQGMAVIRDTILTDRMNARAGNELEDRKGFQCTRCGGTYCMGCILAAAPPHRNGGRACFQCGNHYRRLESTDKWTFNIADRTQAEALYQQARNHMRVGGLKSEALRLLTEAIEADPSFADAYDARSNVYMSMNRIDEALADIEKCAELGGATRDNAIG